jgi:hypothetical protein
VVADSGAIQPGLAAGLDLPAGATVADLVSALAARGRLPRPTAAPAPTTAPPSAPCHPARALADAFDDPALVVDRIPRPRSGRQPTRSGPGGAAESVRPSTRPPIGQDPAILGLSRISRGRVGSRVFTVFFVLVFVVIFVQMLFALLMP